MTDEQAAGLVLHGEYWWVTGPVRVEIGPVKDRGVLRSGDDAVLGPDLAGLDGLVQAPIPPSEPTDPNAQLGVGSLLV